MPYIIKSRRGELNNPQIQKPVDAGDLNYVITKAIKDYVTGGAGPTYQKINDALGALEGAKLEFYRRVVVPYENVKINQNGDVY